MNVQNRWILYDKNGNQVQLTASCYQDGINVEIYARDGVTTLSGSYFADVITAVVLGVEHIEGLPGYCQCQTCRDARATVFAEKITKAEALRLDITDKGFYFPTAGGHMFMACKDAPEICQRCNAHKGNHDGVKL